MTTTLDRSARQPAPVDPVDPTAAPAPGRRYHQALAARPGHAWWRPLASLGLVVALTFGFAIVATLVGVAFVLALNPDPTTMDVFSLDPEVLQRVAPWALLALNLSLAVFVPIVLVANRLAYGRGGAGATHSVTGRFRFGWFARVTLALLPLWALYLGLGFVLEPFPIGTHPMPVATLVPFLAVVLLTTPLQCAGEEYLLRGWLMQAVGGCVRHPFVSIIVATALSAVLFTLAHGSFDPAIMVSLAATSVAACYVTWRTGGLEAAVALHTANNVSIWVFLTALGANQFQGLISTDSTGTWTAALLAVAVDAVAAFVIVRLADAHGVRAVTA